MEKIEELELDKLVDVYLCSKNGKDPTKCIDCASIDGCVAGKRAVELLEGATKPESKSAGPMKSGENMKILARKRAEEASKADDAVIYMMEHFGNNRKQAVLTIGRYRKSFPDLTFNYVSHKGQNGRKKDIFNDDQDEVSLSDFLDAHNEPAVSGAPKSNFVDSLKEERDKVLSECNDISSKIDELNHELEQKEKILEALDNLVVVYTTAK